MPKSFSIISLKRDFRGALKTIKQNLEYNVDAYSPYNTLGNIFFNQGMHNQAVNAYTKALMLNPESNAIHSNLLYSLTLNPNLTNDTRVSLNYRLNNLYSPYLHHDCEGKSLSTFYKRYKISKLTKKI